MACRFLGSVLLLFLTTFGHHVTATRYGGRRIHSEQSEVSPGSYKPAASSYDGHVLPRSSLGSYRLAEKASPRSYSTLAAASRQSGSYGRLVDGPAHQGSVSSYRPTSSWSPKPREASKTNMWANSSPQNGNEFGSRIVSSGPIDFYSGAELQPSLKATSHQQPDSTWLQVKVGVQDGAFGSKVQSPNRNRLAAHPRGPRPMASSSFSNVQQPRSGTSGVHQSKEGIRGAASSSMMSPTLKKQSSVRPRSLPPMTSRSYSRVQHPRSGTSGVLKTKEGMWDTAPAQIGNELDENSISVSNQGNELSSIVKPPQKELSPSVSSRKDIKAAMWTGDFNPNVWPCSKPVPVASRSPYVRQQPHLAAVSSSSRQPSAY